MKDLRSTTFQNQSPNHGAFYGPGAIDSPRATSAPGMTSSPRAKCAQGAIDLQQTAPVVASPMAGVTENCVHKPRDLRRKNQRGQSLVEYLVIVAIVGVGAISIMKTVGQAVKTQFAHVAVALGAKNEGGKIDESSFQKSAYQKSDLTNFWHSSTNKGDSSDQGSNTDDSPGGS